MTRLHDSIARPNRVARRLLLPLALILPLALGGVSYAAVANTTSSSTGTTTGSVPFYAAYRALSNGWTTNGNYESPCPPTCVTTGHATGGGPMYYPSSIDFTLYQDYSSDPNAVCSQVNGYFSMQGTWHQGSTSSPATFSGQMNGQSCSRVVMVNGQPQVDRSYHYESGTYTIYGSEGAMSGYSGTGQYTGTRTCNISTCGSSSVSHQVSLNFGTAYLTSCYYKEGCDGGYAENYSATP